MIDEKQALIEEKRKRKEVARHRIFWFLFALDIALVALIVIQIFLLAGVK